MGILKMDGEFLLHHAEDHSSQHRSPHGPDPADHRHQKDRDAGLESENITRINEGVIAGISSASHPGEAGRNRVNPQLGRVGIHAQAGGGVLVLLDGAQCQPELAVRD